ncbi:hypothetical protein LV779_08275 [Streptomyces thinghirensis]|nr:hypothetical protein [Streptomyces thinghirensis]
MHGDDDRDVAPVRAVVDELLALWGRPPDHPDRPPGRPRPHAVADGAAG